MSERALLALRDGNVHCQEIYSKRATYFLSPFHIDVPCCVAANDIEALLYVAVLFGDINRRAPPLRTDGDAINRTEDSFISFGFTSNCCTHMYIEHSADRALFRVKAAPEDQRYEDFIEVEGKDGRLLTFKSDNKFEVGLIVKYRPDQEDFPEKVWMLCAGVGPRATIGAAWYLCTRWLKLYKYVGEHDFLAVIRVRCFSPKEVRLMFLRTYDKVLKELSDETS